MFSSDIDEITKKIQEGRKVIALVAPTFRKYFREYEWLYLEQLLKEFGFLYAVKIEDACEEMIENEFVLWKSLPENEKLIISSSCPMTLEFVKLEYPDLVKHVSKTESPMALTVKRLRKTEEGAILVFIGPCYEKKRENTSIDYVLRFEDIQFFSFPKEKYFAKKNILGSVGGIINRMNKSENEVTKEIHYYCCSGILECRKMFNKIRNGECRSGYVEVSICENGCIGKS